MGKWSARVLYRKAFLLIDQAIISSFEPIFLDEKKQRDLDLMRG